MEYVVLFLLVEAEDYLYILITDMKVRDLVVPEEGSYSLTYSKDIQCIAFQRGIFNYYVEGIIIRFIIVKGFDKLVYSYSSFDRGSLHL